MRILHLTTHAHMGSITRYILDLGDEVAKRGHVVYAVSSGGGLEKKREFHYNVHTSIFGSVV